RPGILQDTPFATVAMVTKHRNVQASGEYDFNNDHDRAGWESEMERFIMKRIATVLAAGALALFAGSLVMLEASDQAAAAFRRSAPLRFRAGMSTGGTTPHLSVSTANVRSARALWWCYPRYGFRSPLGVVHATNASQASRMRMWMGGSGG